MDDKKKSNEYSKIRHNCEKAVLLTTVRKERQIKISIFRLGNTGPIFWGYKIIAMHHFLEICYDIEPHLFQMWSNDDNFLGSKFN